MIISLSGVSYCFIARSGGLRGLASAVRCPRPFWFSGRSKGKATFGLYYAGAERWCEPASCGRTIILQRHTGSLSRRMDVPPRRVQPRCGECRTP